MGIIGTVCNGKSFFYNPLSEIDTDPELTINLWLRLI